MTRKRTRCWPASSGHPMGRTTYLPSWASDKRKGYSMHLSGKLLWMLFAAALPGLSQPFVWKDLGGGRMELRENGKPALVYNFGVQTHEGAPADRSRCCYIFPVYTPGGVSIDRKSFV